jgi:hypothetical protein
MNVIKNKDIIVFSDDWGRFPSTLQHIGKHLAVNNRIIWVGSLGLRKPEFTIKDIMRAFEKLFKITKKESLYKEVIEAHIFVFPFHDSPIFKLINKSLLKRKLKKLIKDNGFINPMIFTSSPVMESVLGELGESSSHYFCLDDYTLFEGAFKTLGKYEQNLLQKVNSVFCVSDSLLKTRVPVSGNIFFLPQGVDTDHFKFCPEKVSSGKPTIGFFGLISGWIDLSLIVKAAITYPEYDFIIIGPSTQNVEEFSKYTNVRITGPIPYNELPGRAANFSVGLIPFRLNELTIAANPLKLLEYLSLGMPVVSTDLPEIKKFNDYVYICQNNEQFVSLIKTALENDNAGERIKRRQMAEKYSWKSIAEDILNKIKEIDLSKK